MKVVRTVVFALAGFLTFACESIPDPVALSSRETQEIEKNACREPIRVVIAPDQTLSMKTAGVRPAKAEDLKPLIERLMECGGEIGVVFIRDVPSAGAERLAFPEPPVIPEKPIKKNGEEDYEFSDRIAEYHQALIDRRKRIDANKVDLHSGKEEFEERVRALFERQPVDQTDFNSAINIADVFLSESDDIWANKPRKYAVIVSDALDTRKRPRFRFNSGAHVFWVNATTDDGKLAGIQFTRVESLTAAIGLIVAMNPDEGGNKDAKAKQVGAAPEKD